MSKWTWSDKEDDELYRNGTTVMWACGSTKSIQKFVEALSEKLDSKCDFSFSAGRAHIDVFPEVAEQATALVNDEEFMKQFIVPYESGNDDYFQVLH